MTIARMTTAPGQFELHDQLQRLDPSERGAAARFLADHPPRAGAPVAVVIPAYNEEPTVGAVIGEVPEMTGGLRSEVIVVVDGARDQTAEQARGAGALVCDVPVNRGQGAALRLGYWLARAVRGIIFLCVFLPLAAQPALVVHIVQSTWQLITTPVRWWRWLTGCCRSSTTC